MTESEIPLDDQDFDDDVKDVIREPRYIVKYLVFPIGNRAYGGGGWSRRARSRPAPEVISLRTDDVIFNGKSAIINGIRRLKANIWSVDGSPIKIDYHDLDLKSDELPPRNK